MVESWEIRKNMMRDVEIDDRWVEEPTRVKGEIKNRSERSSRRRNVRDIAWKGWSSQRLRGR